MPTTKVDSLYPHGRRIHAIFKMAAAGEALANLVSIQFKYLLENKVDGLRNPVGPDALIFLGVRATLSDEGYIRLFGEPSAEKIIAMYREITGADLPS